MTENRTPILAVRDLVVRYGAIQALKGASLDVYPGEIVAVIGANGAGKSTMMNAIMGDVPRVSGEILLDGVALPAKSFQVVSAGVSLSPEGRKVFAPLTVLENLDMGAFPLSDKAEIERLKQSVFELFPRLLERKNQYAGTLSGGEQQMLAIGRALMSSPKLLMLDEPSMGLAPILVEQIFDIIRRLHENGTTILLVEQNAQMALSVADRAYVMETGSISLSGTGKELAESDQVKKAYLGG